MHVATILMLLLALAAPLFAQQAPPANAEANALYMQAVAAYDAKDYGRSIELGLQAIEKGAKRGTVPYHLACCYALLGKSDDAFKYLHLAIERGWRNAEHLAADSDLDSLHADARWPEVVKACEAARDADFAKLKEPALARELLSRMAVDQKARFAIQEEMKKLKPGEVGVPRHKLPPELDIQKIDADNTAFMKQVIEKHGWPGKSLVGEEAANAAWLLVQHADQDPAFQDQCLGLVKAAFEKGEVTGQQLAYLTDRVLVAQGKKQLYGTQFRGVGDELGPAPIEDEANVDARRKAVGLSSMAEYTKLMKGR